MKNHQIYTCLLLFLCFTIGIKAQIPSNVYHAEEKNDGKTIHHELKISDTYFIHTIYQNTPAKFIKTLGGFYTVMNDTLALPLEFNSNFENDSISLVKYKFEMHDGIFFLHLKEKMKFVPSKQIKQDLEGQWLFATRGPDKGQERRGDSSPRKTLKFLQNGRFQWIAYNTETMKFHGTGGGAFTSENGVYQEIIEYFPRDNSRVGAVLAFEYYIEGDDWHHKGKNSKGEPMYEIWARRN